MKKGRICAAWHGRDAHFHLPSPCATQKPNLVEPPYAMEVEREGAYLNRRQKNSRWMVDVTSTSVDVKHETVPFASVVDNKHSELVLVVSCSGMVVRMSEMEVEVVVVVTTSKRVEVGTGVHAAAINTSQGRRAG